MGSSIGITTMSSTWLSTVVDPVITDNVKFSLGPLAPSSCCSFSWQRVTSDPLSNNAYVSTGGRSTSTSTLKGTTLKETRSPVPVAAVTETHSGLFAAQFEPSVVFNIWRIRLSWLRFVLLPQSLEGEGVAVCCALYFTLLSGIWNLFRAYSRVVATIKTLDTKAVLLNYLLSW